MAEQSALSRPPEGAIAGENVPTENSVPEYWRIAQARRVALLKARGEPYTSMRDYELAEIARRMGER